MPKKHSRQQESPIDFKGIALLILALAFFYLIYEHFLALIIVGSLSLIITIAVIILGAYFILPLLGIEGIAGLLALIGLSKR